MKTISQLIQKYTNIQPPHATLKKSFINAVEEVINIQLSQKQVNIFKTTAQIKTPSTIKNEIRLHQHEILKKVENDVGDNNALSSIL